MTSFVSLHIAIVPSLDIGNDWENEQGDGGGRPFAAWCCPSTQTYTHLIVRVILFLWRVVWPY